MNLSMLMRREVHSRQKDKQVQIPDVEHAWHVLRIVRRFVCLELMNMGEDL